MVLYDWSMTNDIDFSVLEFSFTDKPLLIGGKAMEYYGIRKAGDDIDFVASRNDHARLVRQYPDGLQDLYGDIGVVRFGFEIWNTICTFDYDHLKEHAVEKADYLIVSLEKLLFLKTLAKDDEKCKRDLG